MRESLADSGCGEQYSAGVKLEGVVVASLVALEGSGVGDAVRSIRCSAGAGLMGDDMVRSNGASVRDEVAGIAAGGVVRSTALSVGTCVTFCSEVNTVALSVGPGASLVVVSRSIGAFMDPSVALAYVDVSGACVRAAGGVGT